LCILTLQSNTIVVSKLKLKIVLEKIKAILTVKITIFLLEKKKIRSLINKLKN